MELLSPQARAGKPSRGSPLRLASWPQSLEPWGPVTILLGNNGRNRWLRTSACWPSSPRAPLKARAQRPEPDVRFLIKQRQDRTASALYTRSSVAIGSSGLRARARTARCYRRKRVDQAGRPTECRGTGWDTPLRSTEPIGVKATPSEPTASTTSWLTSTCPGSARSAILAATFTVRPK
jgi:hypothetical protein